MRDFLAKHDLPAYYLVTFATSWGLWFASGVLSYGGGLPPLDHGWLLAQIGVFCPSLWALVFTAILHPGKRRQCLAVLAGVYVPAAGLGLAIAVRNVAGPGELPVGLRIAVIGFALIITSVFLFPRRLVLAERGNFNRKTPLWLGAAALQLPLFFLAGWVLINLGSGHFAVGVFGTTAGSPGSLLAVLFAFDLIFGGALGEEMGWRGFALPRLLESSPPLGAALVLGVVWSLWHLPIDLAVGFGATGLAGAVFRMLFTCGLSVIMTWYFIRSGQGLASALLIHATLNWLPVMEFNQYETAMGALTVLMLLFALLVGFGDPAMRADRGPRVP